MKNEVYEADYSQEKAQHSFKPNLIFDTAVKCGFFKRYTEIMHSIPKYIVPKDKQAYEELLPKLDALAKRHSGKIKGIVDYERFDSHIYITLPFFEFSHIEEHELLRELNDKAHSLTFTVEDGMIRLSVMINYFEEIGDVDHVFDLALEESEELKDVLMQSISDRIENLLNNPQIGPILKKAASNAGRPPEEYIENCLLEMDENPEEQLRIFTELLEAKEELKEEN